MTTLESEERPWGRYFVLHDEPNYKLKRIEVDPEGDYHTNIIINALKHGLLLKEMELLL